VGLNRKVKLTGWNLQNSGFCELRTPPTQIGSDSWEKGIIRGNGQSYGDASLNYSGVVYQDLAKPLSELIVQDDGDSVLVKASLTVGALCEYLASTNRFMEVVPGSIRATIGGCVASDIHGKNDYKFGSFGHSILGLEVLSPSGIEWIESSSNPKFPFVLGGYGLTGIINSVKLRVRPVPGVQLHTKKYHVKNINELFDKMQAIETEYEFLVGWMECSRQGFGNGYVEGANWINSRRIESDKSRSKGYSLPNLRINLINPFSISVHNFATNLSARKKQTNDMKESSYQEYLFPTFSIRNWNVLFGSNGFHEIQLLIPDTYREQAILELSKIARKYPIFLAGFKKISQSGKGVLSFTRPGWSVAINIPGKYIDPREVLEIQELFASKFNSPQYLTKDSCLTPEIFELMYPRAQEFREFRINFGYKEFFESEMSRRLLI
jgi:decaprenylphospho-beta-D-ribofuranose 2-oxidase